MTRARKRGGFYRDRRVIRRIELSRAPKAGSQRSLMGSSRPGGVCRARPGAGTNIPSQSPVAPNRRSRPALLNVVDVGQSCALVRMIRGNARRRDCRTSPRCPSIGSLTVMLTVHSRPLDIMQCSETLQPRVGTSSFALAITYNHRRTQSNSSIVTSHDYRVACIACLFSAAARMAQATRNSPFPLGRGS